MNNILMIFGLCVLGIVFISTCNIICFLIGARTFQNVRRDEEIKLPSINPIEKIKDVREQREANKEQERMKAIWDNVNNYTGDSTGQKDIPS